MVKAHIHRRMQNRELGGAAVSHGGLSSVLCDDLGEWEGASWGVGSNGENSACNAGDPGLISGLGRPPGGRK